MIAKEKSLVGFAIATFNRKHRLKECIDAINRSSYNNILICVTDDGSSDGTWEMLDNEFPYVEKTKGNGNLWWAESTNVAIKKCLKQGCDYVVILNDDCIISEDTILKFVNRSDDYPGSVITPVTMNIKSRNYIWWAGSSWGPLKGLPFIWLIRQKFSHNTHVSNLPNLPYRTCEFTGRAIFIPKSVFKRFGFIDSKVFPQYGSDSDFALKITTGGGNAIVDPNNKVFLYTEEAGQNTSGNLLTLPVRFFKLMFYRKHGEATRFWWHLLKRYCPWYAIIPSYIFILILTFLRVFKILPFIKKITG